jgi:hypothetical protein
MTDSSKVIERIRKLLAHARGKGTTVNEAETAARLAAELMQANKLSEIDVAEEATADGSAIVDLPAGRKGFMATWRFALVTAVARAFFCEAIGLRSGRSRKVRIVGRREDAEVVLEVSAFLAEEIERLTKEYGRLPDDLFIVDELLEGSSSTERRKAYRAGLAYGVSSTLHEQAKKWRASSEKALAIYRRGREEIRLYMGGKFNPREVTHPGEDNAKLSAFEEGFVRGKQIEVGPRTRAVGAPVPVQGQEKRER